MHVHTAINEILETDENFQTWWFSGMIWSDEERLLSGISKWINGHFFKMGVEDNGIFWKSKSYSI